MLKLKTTRVAFVLLAFAHRWRCSIQRTFPFGRRLKDPVAPNIRITPPAPVFNDQERVAELMQRRERVAQSIGPQSMLDSLQHRAARLHKRRDYPYRQENNLYYLTNLKQKNATLVLLPGNTKTTRDSVFAAPESFDRDVGRSHVQRRRSAPAFRRQRDLAMRASLIRSSRHCAIASLIGQNPKTFSCQISLPTTTLSNDHGFTALFDAAAKGEAGLFMLVPGRGRKS